MSEYDSLLEPGFYGKLPTYGDFIQKRLPRDFVAPWDEWLQEGISAAKERLAGEWLTYYLNCPAWKFIMSAGICGEQGCAGVTIPSVDKVGRYFNFTLAAMLPSGMNPSRFLLDHHDWLDELENLAISILEEEMDQDRVDESINNLPVFTDLNPASEPSFERNAEGSRVVCSGSVEAVDLLPVLLHNLITIDHAQYGLWWHRGSSQVSAQLITCSGMPAVETYLSLLMDEELVEPPQKPEVDYLDELLSD